MKGDYPESLKGYLITAVPSLADPNFSQTVTCICEHTLNGALGVVINRVHDELKLKDLFKELEIEYEPRAGEIPVYVGGPVHNDKAFVLHGEPFGWEGSIMVTDDLAMSNTLDIFHAIAEGRSPDKLIVAVGCAGWGPLQMESEILQNAWLTYPAYNEIIFQTNIEDRWNEAMNKMGINPALLSNIAGHA